MNDKILFRILGALLLVLLMAVSIFLGVSRFARPESYSGIIDSLDSRMETVLKLSAASTVASAAISMIPDDTATPIAAKLADFTEYFMLVLVVLYAEKYLLPIIGTLVFVVLLPAALGLFLWGSLRASDVSCRYSTKVAAFAVVLVLVIPTSSWVSDKICETYRQSIDRTITAAESAVTQETGDGSWYSRLTEAASGLTQKAADILNYYVESLAVLIVTSCGIPVLVLLFFSWVIKLLTGLDLSLPRSRRVPERVE